MSTIKSRSFALLLYPKEDETHRQALQYIINNYSYAYITHDKDIYQEYTEEHAKGEIKKEHTHVVIYFDNARHNTSIAEEIGIEKNYLQKSNFVAITKYLIHQENKEKYQYKREEIITNMKEKVESALNLKGDYKTLESKEVLNMIKENKIESFADLVYMAENKGLLQEIMKNSYFYKQIVRF